MKRKKICGMMALIATFILAFGLAGCPTTKTKAKGAGDEVSSSAVDEATDAVSDNVREGVREGVDSAFKGIFRR